MDNKQKVKHIFNKYADIYQEKYRNVDLYAESLDLFCDSLKMNRAKILEIGCGPGNVTQYLLNKNSQLDILGIDLAKNMIELAKINNPQASFKVMDCRDINQITDPFDGIMCGFCLPYLDQFETNKLIQDATQLLKSNGILYLSCMQDDYKNSRLQGSSTGDDDSIQMYYYQTQQLIDWLKQSGFLIMQSYQLVNPQQNDPSI